MTPVKLFTRFFHLNYIKKINLFKNKIKANQSFNLAITSSVKTTLAFLESFAINSENTSTTVLGTSLITLLLIDSGMSIFDFSLYP